MTWLAFPFGLGADGRSAFVERQQHIDELIEQVLFTQPGERVNRPDFGSGLMQLVFAPQGDEFAQATRALVSASLQRWLGALVEVDDVDVTTRESELLVTVRYRIRRSGQRRAAQFARSY